MFKKRGHPSKATDLNAELSSIQVSPSQTSLPQTPRLRSNITIDGEVGSSNQRIQSGSSYQILDSIQIQENQPVNSYTIESKTFQKYQRPKMENIIQISEQSSQSQAPPSQTLQTQKPPRVIVIEDEEGELLQIVQDLQGGLDEDYQYESEIIKKALTKQNYARLKRPAQQQNPMQSNEKRLLNKISLQSVTKSLGAQISSRELKVSEIEDKVKYHKETVRRSRHRLALRVMEQDNNKQKLEKVKKMLSLIYYRASDIKQFTLKGLAQQVEEENPEFMIIEE